MQTIQPYEEKKMLLQIAAGDENAFRKIFYMHNNKLAAFILRITNSLPLTEEIIQDSFLKIWLDRTELTKINNFQAYLFVIARNHAFNYLKHYTRKQLGLQKWLQHNEMESLITLPQENEVDDKIALLETAIDQLPPQQKKVYMLSRYKNMKQEEIAVYLNLSLETVKKHMVLALRFIRQYIRNNAESLSVGLIFLLKKIF